MEHPPIAIPSPKRGKLVVCCLLVVCALISATFMRGIFSSAETYRGIYETLDERQNNVLSLAFGAAVISGVISALPDDMGTALSTEYADFYTGFAFVVSALLLEKYLLTTIGFTFFTLIIPICCLLVIASLIASPHDPKRYKRQKMAKKLFAFGLVLFLMTPLSVFIGRQIDDSYRASVQETIKNTEEATEKYETSLSEDEEKKKDAQDNNPLALVQQQLENASSAVTGAIDTMGSFATGILPWAINQLRVYAELFAVMVVTSIVIPLLVPVAVYLIFKILFLSDTDITIPSSVMSALGASGVPLAAIPPAQPQVLVSGTAVAPVTTLATQHAAEDETTDTASKEEQGN